jgi:hypothetical protein
MHLVPSSAWHCGIGRAPVVTSPQSTSNTYTSRNAMPAAVADVYIHNKLPSASHSGYMTQLLNDCRTHRLITISHVLPARSPTSSNENQCVGQTNEAGCGGTGIHVDNGSQRCGQPRSLPRCLEAARLLLNAACMQLQQVLCTHL